MQEFDPEAQKLKLKEGYKEVKGVLYHQSLSFVSEAIRTELINRHHDDSLVAYFRIENIRELLARKYYRSILRHNIKAYVKSYDVYLASKAVRNNHYGNL